MDFGAYIAVLIIAPFLALSAWWSGHFYAPAPPPVACTMEAKQCPDGSWVGRVPPACNFAPCPSATSTTPAPAPVARLHISSLSPASGEVGTTVTVHGSGFTSDNTVHFGYGALVHVASKNGTTLTFSVPSVLNPSCYYSNPRCLIASRETTAGKYEVSVQNTAGTSNTLTFVVTEAHTSVAPVIYRISPAAGGVGTTISVTGFGFTNDNTVLMDGLVAAKHVAVSHQIAVSCTTDPSCHGGINQTIEFTIPDSLSPDCPPGSMCPMFLRQVTLGNYPIVVKNENGESAPVQFTVTGNSSGGGTAPTISGLDAPLSLPIGTPGTWIVHVTAMSNSTGSLHYSVVWGDETAAGSAIMAPKPTEIQTSATFTHSYSHSGSYNPTFTVTNDSGQSATASATITITPLF